MLTECKRTFKVNQTVYVVDYWGTDNGTQAFEARAVIIEIDENNMTFGAILYGDTYQRYRFKDYGRLIFDTKEEAVIAANKLLKPGSFVYQRIGKKTYKKEVLGISGHYVGNVYDLIINLDGGQDISTKEIGVSIFLNKSDERQ